MEENAELTRFAEQLARLNAAMAQLFATGNVALFKEMNLAIKEMHRLQHGSDEPVFRALQPECSLIYANFDMIIAVLRTTEDGVIDEGARSALDRFLHNIDGAVINIATALGLVNE